jgi:hypothetical protein
VAVEEHWAGWAMPSRPVAYLAGILVRVEDGRSRITLDNDRAGTGAVVAQLASSCDPSGAVEITSQQPGVRRYERVERLTGGSAAIWYDRFPGGCVTSQMHSTADTEATFANEAPRLLGFTTRAELGRALSQRSGGPLELAGAIRRGGNQVRACLVVMTR